MDQLTENLKDPKFKKLFRREKMLVEVASLLYQTMESKNISRKVLAKKLGVKKKYIKNILGGYNKKLTLKNVADLFNALDKKILIALEE